MENIQNSLQPLDILGKRKQTLRTAGFIISFIICVIMVPAGLIGLAMGGGWIYFLITGWIIAISAFYRQHLLVSFFLTFILGIFLFCIDYFLATHWGKESELLPIVGILIICALFQIYSLLAERGLLDKVLIKIPAFIHIIFILIVGIVLMPLLGLIRATF